MVLMRGWTTKDMPPPPDPVHSRGFVFDFHDEKILRDVRYKRDFVFKQEKKEKRKKR